MVNNRNISQICEYMICIVFAYQALYCFQYCCPLSGVCAFFWFLFSWLFLSLSWSITSLILMGFKTELNHLLELFIFLLHFAIQQSLILCSMFAQGSVSFHCLIVWKFEYLLWCHLVKSNCQFWKHHLVIFWSYNQNFSILWHPKTGTTQNSLLLPLSSLLLPSMQ